MTEDHPIDDEIMSRHAKALEKDKFLFKSHNRFYSFYS